MNNNLINQIQKSSFLVGGAVRDTLLGKIPSDRDYVVVGRTPQQMIDAGFSQVGADFPVFLHPETGEEYALARTERKNGKGYKGFITEFDPSVTIVEDLRRRDLTINSMALDRNGNVVDPFGGVEDLRSKILRHTSEAFVEDPTRVLRVARFAAKLDFGVAGSTFDLMREIAQTEEFANITIERVAGEMFKALETSRPSRFFWMLRVFGALKVHFPEVQALVGQTQPAKWHPEGDAFDHTMEVLDRAAFHGFNTAVRFGALVHDFGKGLTKAEDLPHHYGHEAAGVPVVEQFTERMKVSSEISKVAAFVTRFHMHVHKVKVLNAKTVVKVFEHMNRGKIEFFADTLRDVSICDAQGRGPTSWEDGVENANLMHQLLIAASRVKMSDFFEIERLKSMSVSAIQNEQRRLRVKAVATAKQNSQD